MKSLIIAAAIGLASTLTLAAEPASAAASGVAKAPTAQQNKMKSCNAEAKAKELKGAERKAFMKECLSAGMSPSQKEKMTSCNAEAKTKGLKGAERKAFMKECLSAH